VYTNDQFCLAAGGGGHVGEEACDVVVERWYLKANKVNKSEATRTVE